MEKYYDDFFIEEESQIIPLFNIENKHILHHICEHGDIESFIYLGNRCGVECMVRMLKWFDMYGTQPLTYAIRNKHYDMLDLAYQNFKDFFIVDGVWIGLIHFAVHIGCEDYIDYLLENKKVDITEDGDTFLHYIFYYNDRSLTIFNKYTTSRRRYIEYLKDMINHQNIYGNTPLYIACRFGFFKNNIAAIDVFIFELGADPFIKNMTGYVPLDILKSRTTEYSHLKKIMEYMETLDVKNVDCE